MASEPDCRYIGAQGWSRGYGGPADTPRVITHPDWLERPSADDLARYYPGRAARMNVEGRATIGCVVTVAGTLADCRVLFESPPDQDFGLAALKLATLFKMSPATKDGAPVANAHVVVPLVFRIPQG